MNINFIEQDTFLAGASSDVTESAGTNVYGVIIRWTLIIGMFLMPILFLPWTTSVLELNKQLLLLVMAGTGLIAWLISLVSTSHFTWRSTPFDKGVLAILVASLVGTILSISRFNSLFGVPNNVSGAFITIFAFSIMYFLIVNTSDDRGEMLTKGLTVSLTVALVYGLLQIFGVYLLKFPFAISHAFNSVGSINGLGVVAAIGLPLLGNAKVKGRVRYVNMVGLVAALALLVILNWWVLWTIAIAGMAGVVAFGSLSHERFSISRFILPMTVIVLGVFLLVVNFNLAAVKNNLPVEVAPSFNLSGQIARSVSRENIFTGYGPETFSLAFDKYGASQLSNSTLSTAKFFDATSEVFNAVTQGGLLMVLALLVLVWSFIQGVIAYIRRRHSGESSEAQVMWATLVAVGAAFLLYPFGITLMFVAYASLALASLTLWGDHNRMFNVEDNVMLSLASSLGFIAGLILVLVGVYFGFSVYFGDVRYAQALQEKDINKAASGLVSAVNWNGQNDSYYRSASQAALALLSQELNKPADKSDTQRQTRIQNYMSSAVSLAKTATTLGPLESANWENLGVVYQNLLGFVDGVDTLSEAAYLKAATLRPGDASYYNSIGNLYLAKAQLARQVAAGSPNAAQLNQVAVEALSKAEANFKKAIEISNNFGLAIYNLGVVYDAEGKLTDAIKQLERIAPFNSDQPNLLFELGLLYYRNGNKDKAFDSLQKVLVLQPDFANAHWYLSLIYEERKDIPNAIDQLQKILEVESNKDNQTVITKMQQLQAGQTAPVKGINQKPI